MHLKSIKLVGFKSFVDPTLIPIKSHMNAIVGPNGCGKSNVVDAIRWVVGEISAKQLRGQSMTDVIFNGTSGRKPVGKAAVELLFDNSDGRLVGEYAGFAEIAVRREVGRDGSSNYFINGTACRRKDIIDIFLGTGLGPRSYAIIEQGMISKLIEAKPEELRIFLEEVAGISKYKERRRDTENRMRRTQENLDRLTDLRDELDKQARHLKRQANAAERYKELKEQERLLQAEIRALHWRSFNDELAEFDKIIVERQTNFEESVANQRRVEADIEKMRDDQTDLNDTQNEIQKRYYGFAAEIARIEQRISDMQNQIQRWQQELEETESLWQELQDNSIEYQQQIEELNEELSGLNPQTSDLTEQAERAQRALQTAQQQMHAWQQTWDSFQEDASQNARAQEVGRTNISHYQQQLQQLADRIQRLQNSDQWQQLNALNEEVVPLGDKVQSLQQQITDLQQAMQQLAQQINTQREQNTQINHRIAEVRDTLQDNQSRYASLHAVQQSALGYDDQQTNDWLANHELSDKPRLGKELDVNGGWELAVETVLRDYFDAVCINDIADVAREIAGLQQGQLTLLDRGAAQDSADFNKAPTLASQVRSSWSLSNWLDGVYIAEDLTDALSLRQRLSRSESVITKDGIWLGVNWIRVSKAADSEGSILLREQELTELESVIATQKAQLAEQERLLTEGEQRLSELESQRDDKQQNYQAVSGALTEAQADLSAKKSRLQEIKQQNEKIKSELNDCEAQQTALQESLHQAEQQAQIVTEKAEQLAATKQKLVSDRSHYSQNLEEARTRAQQDQQRVDEVQIRVSANENQLALLTQTVSRDKRQLEQLTERRDVLKSHLADTDAPINELNEVLQVQLNHRLEVEKELRTAQGNLDAHTQAMRTKQAELQRLQNLVSSIQTEIQEVRMNRQAIEVRQTTVTEQIAEAEFNLETLLENMADEANLIEWEQNAEKVANKISRLGPINLAAIDEFEQLSERKEYLDKQNDDLMEALELLHGAIRKIDRETRTKFKDTYQKVDEGFQQIFPKVFGGGSAHLELSDDDLLRTGVLVRAQPPGKRNTTIHMLSGGEKALTAIALVFSMFRLNPAPFCILDEVDAPLDDLNVGRFCQLVKAMAADTQFIVISHNKVTIESADYLMGVTMQEPGVSRIVSVDIEEAIAMAEA